MDRKSILVVAVCLILLVAFHAIVNKVLPPVRVTPAVTNSASMTPAALQPNTNAAVAAPGIAASPVAPATNAALFVVDTNAPEELLVVTNENARYVFTSHGGGLKLIELVSIASKRELQSGHLPVLNAAASTPILTLLGDGVQGNGIFRLSETATGVRAEKQLPNGLNILKDFALGSNYLLTTTVSFENSSTQTLVLPPQQWVIGTATPMAPDDNGQVVGMTWFNGEKTADILGGSYFSTRGFGCSTRIPPAEFRGGQSNVFWAAAHNQFFTILAIPQQPAQEVVVHRLDLPRPTGKNARLFPANLPPPQGYEITLAYPALTFAPTQSVQRQIVLFAGPKEYRTLSRVAAQLGNNVDSVMGFDSIFPFYKFGGFFAKALLLAMNAVHSLFSLSYGWVIIAITVLLKVIFWPLTAASTRSMKRMQALQPQMKAIAEKYKDDPLKKNQKTMEFMKENKVNPMGGCLPMVIQMPVFIGFFTMIRSAIELRGAAFLWIPDLSKPDTLYMIRGLDFIPFLGIPGVGLPFNLLPLLMGATMLWQAHQTPPTPGMDPMQQKLMRYMPLMFMVFLYNYSAGLALYWTVNNLLTVMQTKLTKAQAVTPAAKAPALTSPPKKRK